MLDLYQSDMLEAALPDSIRVVARRNPLMIERVEIRCPVGMTLAEMVATCFDGKMDPILRSHGTAKIGDHEIPSNLWHVVKPKLGADVNFMLVPQGGIGRTLLGIALVVAVAFAAPYLAGALLPLTAAAAAAGSAAAAGTMAATTALITAGISFAGNMLLNALIPIRQPALASRQQSQTYSIGGSRNTASPWGAIPALLGRHRVAPLYAARAYTEASGNDQWLRLLFVFGYGPIRIEDILIGQTSIADFDDVQMEIREGLPGDAPITLYPGQVLEQQLNLALHEGSAPVVTRSDPDADELSIDWTYPGGLVKMSSKGKPKETSTVITVEYRLVGNLTWVSLGTFDISESKQEPFRIGKVWSVPRGQYDVRLQNIDDQSDTPNPIWSSLRTIRHEVPFTFSKPLALLAMRIKAQGQLNGVVDTLSAIATSRCKAWNGSAWIDNVETSAPADLYRYVLQHPANALPRSDAQIDLPTLQAWKTDNVAKGLEFNMNRDAAASVLDTLADVAAAGRASPTRPNGKWSVIIDKPQDEIADLFTERNSWDFQVERNYRTIPDAWRIRFVDRQYNWKQDERIVYREGVTPEAATDFEGIELRGVTDAGKLWTEGQRRFRELIVRADTYSFSTTWESLRVTRGDRIKVQSDVTRWGIAAGRVKDITGTIIELDDEVEMEAGHTYSLRWRNGITGASVVLDVVNQPGKRMSVRVLGAERPAVGDIWMFGLQAFESHDLIIKAIEPGEDLTAKITAVDYGQPYIDEADDLVPPEWVPRQPLPDRNVPAVPIIIGVTSGNTSQVVGDDGTVYSPVGVGLAAGQGAETPTAGFQVRHRYQGSTLPWKVQDVAGGAYTTTLAGYVFEDLIEVSARALSRDGVPSAWTDPPVDHTVAARSVVPPNPNSLTVVRQNSGMRTFSWTLADPEGDGPPPDLAGYRIRSRAGSGWTWNDLTPLNDGLLLSSPYETGAPGAAGPYTFGIAAYNRSGLVSAVPFVVDVTLGPGVAPPAPTFSTPSGPVGSANPFVSGTGTPLIQVKLYADGVLNTTSPATITADAAGNWSGSLSGLGLGVRQITAVQVDSLGNPSGPSLPIFLNVGWFDPDTSVHVDFVGKRYRIGGTVTNVVSAADWAAIFTTITTSATIVTQADGSLRSIAANTLPVSDLGLEVWEARTNRCTNYNAAPTTGAPGNANATLSGDPAATLTMVTDTTNLNAGKLASLVTAGILSGTVYRLNNTTGTADAFVTFGGTVSGTVAHRGFVWARGSAGRLEIGGVSVVTIAAGGTTWTRYEGTRTPAVGTEQMRVAAPAGADIYFILNQLETGAHASAPIVVAGAAATRNAPLIVRAPGADFNATEGYFGCKARSVANSASNGTIIQTGQSNANSDLHLLGFLTTATVRGLTQVGAVTQANLTAAYTAPTDTQLVLGYKLNDFGMSKDGAAVLTDTSGTVPSGTPVTINISRNTVAALNGIVQYVKWGVTKPANADIQRKAGWVAAA